ncbi:Lysine-specific permease [Smittium mucronatum]|uniref:Lysine-specific permease n=1 Tax=Smittium mucronatum TaxID=133383 RepID=A0A1R0GLT6_9FUNG|nr:Lysine-specific permease [Smittium mucronatum]
MEREFDKSIPVNPKLVSVSNAQKNLNRSLKSRHMSMIALGGAIGTGLFVGSGSSLALSGPGGTLVSYCITGVMVFFIMGALSEMASFIPVSGSFSDFATRFVDPALGMATGWSYWFAWTIVVSSELVACGIIMQFWLPHVHPVIWGLIIAAIIFFLNIIHVKGFGESEFWFALLKVIAVIAFIIVGILVASGAVGGKKYGFTYWKEDGATFVDGFRGTLLTFVFAGFSFMGTESIGVTAGESKNPRRDVPRAIRSLFWRILIFYVLAIFVMSLVIKYNDPSLTSAKVSNIGVSPFTTVFRLAGLGKAADVMNAVILLSVISAGNAGMYTLSRLPYTLYHKGMGPKFLSRTSKSGIPYISLTFSLSFSVILLLISIAIKNVYTFLINSAGIMGFLTWVSITITHIHFRRALASQKIDMRELPYKVILYPYGTYFSLFLIIFVIGGQMYATIYLGTNALNFVSTFIGIPLFIGLYLFWKFYKKTKYVDPLEVDLTTDCVMFNNYNF